MIIYNLKKLMEDQEQHGTQCLNNQIFIGSGIFSRRETFIITESSTT